MLTLIYLQAERVRSVYAQTTEMMPVKEVRESAGGRDASLDVGAFGIKAIGKANRTEKTIVEATLTAEQMLAQIIAQVPEKTDTVLVEDKNDWNQVVPGSLVLLSGTFSLECYGGSREDLWKSFCASPTEKLIRYDLYLRGTIATRELEVAFRSEWFTGPNAFPFLCRPSSLNLEVLALVFALPGDGPGMLQPVAIGQGFMKRAKAARTDA